MPVDPHLTDDDNPELTREQIFGMRPASEVLPRRLYESLVAAYNSRHGRVGGMPMNRSGLDDRHRDKDGRIQQKRSDTLNKNLSRPIPGFSADTTLGEMRKRTGEVAERAVRRETEKKR